LVDSETLVQDRLPRGVGEHEHARDGSLLHGRYRLLERLGAGGFGVVWRAQDELLRREVALKRIPLPPDLHSRDGPDDRDEPQAGERASREALASARLAHPAIVALYEAYVDDDAFYLVSELVHGDTLAQLLAADALSDEELLEIGVALANALAHAHARGVIHRDVKPQNVLVPRDPVARDTPAKLTDFGGASLSGVDGLTHTGETLGTLAYMAPEQSEGREVDVSTDLYSLALVLYEGLTGVNPVRGPTPAATVRRIGRPLPALAARRPDLPRGLAHALDTALAVDPAARGTLEELRAALEQAVAESAKRRRGLLGPRTAPRALEPHPANRPATAVRDAAAVEHRAVPASKGVVSEGIVSASPRRLLPRAVWLGCALAVAAWQATSGRPGVALVVLAAIAAPLLLMGPCPGVGWLAGALAPLLGLAGLAGAYPAIAGQASRWPERAALGALGYWWLILAGPLLAGGRAGARLWLEPSAGMPPRTVWEGSLSSSATHVVGPALTTGVLFGAILWAAAAVVLPWIVRGVGALLDTLAAVAWSAALLAATPYFDAGLSVTAPLPHPRGAVLGALLGAAIAVAARALRGPVSVRHP
jgi:eukaryotic-like serine/threonine-protein kinase